MKLVSFALSNIRGKYKQKQDGALKGEFLMKDMAVIFEIPKYEDELCREISELFPQNKSEALIESFDGNDILQVIVPTVAVLAPAISTCVQKYFENSKITIKYEGIELTVMGYEKAMKMLKQLSQMKKEE